MEFTKPILKDNKPGGLFGKNCWETGKISVAKYNGLYSRDITVKLFGLRICWVKNLKSLDIWLFGRWYVWCNICRSVYDSYMYSMHVLWLKRIWTFAERSLNVSRWLVIGACKWYFFVYPLVNCYGIKRLNLTMIFVGKSTNFPWAMFIQRLSHRNDGCEIRSTTDGRMVESL